MSQTLQDLKGLVAVVSLTGTIRDQTAVCLSNMRSFNDRNNWHNIEYATFPAVLVEAGRDDAAKHMLVNNYEWMLQIDADAAPFADLAVPHFLNRLFVDFPQFDMMGGYCQLRPSGQPTIDTGSGTWEEHYPGEGVLPVCRTGGHFFMVKQQAFKRFGPPWFRTRLPNAPVRAMKDLDNFARMKLGGNNPLTEHPEWDTLLHEAVRVSGPEQTPVGEDSAFCDNLRASGGLIAVDTDFVVGHVGTEIIMPQKYVDNVKTARRRERMLVGVLE